MEKDFIGSTIFFCKEGFGSHILYLAICHFTKLIRKFVALKCSLSVDHRAQTESAEASPE